MIIEKIIRNHLYNNNNTKRRRYTTSYYTISLFILLIICIFIICMININGSILSFFIQKSNQIQKTFNNYNNNIITFNIKINNDDNIIYLKNQNNKNNSSSNNATQLINNHFQLIFHNNNNSNVYYNNNNKNTINKKTSKIIIRPKKFMIASTLYSYYIYIKDNILFYIFKVPKTKSIYVNETSILLNTNDKNNNNFNNNYNIIRNLEEVAYDDNYYNNNKNLDDAYATKTTDDDIIEDSKQYGYNELCSTFLVTFLEGSTDAHDTCTGIMNAYTAAGCSHKRTKQTNTYNNHDDQYDYDDYFAEFTEHQCCQAIQTHHSSYCEEDTLLTNFHLFVGAAVLLLCECAKAAVVYYNINFLPEAGVCILVGCTVGSLFDIFSQYFPFHVSNIDDLSFDDDLFLSLLLPPIIFEAALSVSKFEFKRRRGAIFMFSVFGTVISTFSTGLMVHYLSKYLVHAQTFPMLDSLVFGALISSIDPVAILSVLTHLNLDQRDTIFILVFGESLLNDGIAITVFQTLVNRFDGKTTDNTTSIDEILDAVATFMIAMFGSIVVGLACGCGAWVYFNLLGKLLPPVMEVGSFFLWALIPYYICDGVGWSGIVSIVAVGFFMDIYIAGPKHNLNYTDDDTPTNSRSLSPTLEQQHQRSQMMSINLQKQLSNHNMINNTNSNPIGYRGMNNDSDHIIHNSNSHLDPLEIKSNDSMQTSRSIGPLPSTERINMSATADRHVRFVAHLTSQLAENAIFSYIGLFLFSNNYDWNPTLVAIAISSCVLSRILMVVIVAYVIFHIYKCRGISSTGHNSSRTAAAIQNPRTQAVLVLAGLRGAVSLALVENVPIYNTVTGEGCEFKQLMKGMTSACILFTTFIFGGGAYYILPHLGISQDHNTNNPPSSPSSIKSVIIEESDNKTHPII